MISDAYRWLPHFARSVLFAVASRYRGYNNGGLELTVKTANEQGINKSELYAGLRLCLMAGLIRQTSPGKHRSGKGIPAKYAVTWRTINEFPALNLIESDRPSDDWRKFEPDSPRPRSLTQAEILLGMRKPRHRNYGELPDQDSIEVSETNQTKTKSNSVASQTKPPIEYEPTHTTAAVSSHTNDKSTGAVTETQVG